MSNKIPNEDTLPCPTGYRWTSGRNRRRCELRKLEYLTRADGTGSIEVLGKRVYSVRVDKHDQFSVYEPGTGKLLGTYHSLMVLESDIARVVVVERLTS